MNKIRLNSSAMPTTLFRVPALGAKSSVRFSKAPEIVPARSSSVMLRRLALSSSAVYTLAFFVFWGVIAIAGLLTRLLEGDPAHINREGASGAFRH